MAFNPAGVAAHPSPNMLAIIFVEICGIALWEEGSSGNKKCRKGKSFAESFRIMPASWAISIIPVQKAITPEIVMQSVTASLEESSAAFVISGICPVNAAKKTPAMIMPAQRRFNIGYLESIFYYKLKVFYERKEKVMLKIKEIFATKCA